MFELNKIYHNSWQKGIHLIPDGSIDLIVTDPPFDMRVHGGGIMNKEKRIKKSYDTIGEYSFDGYDVKPYLKQCRRIMKKFNGYFFGNNKMIKTYIDFAIKHKYIYKVLIWNKLNPLPFTNGNYLQDCEYIVFIRERKTTFNIGLTFEKYYSVQTFPRPQNVKHPNAKPLQLVRNYIEISSNPGDIVFDGFVGSGTAPLAALQLYRNHVSFEREKKWHTLANSRLEKIKHADGIFKQKEIFELV